MNKEYNLLLADDDDDDCDFFKEALDEIPVTTSLSMVHDGVQLMDYLQNNILKNLPDVVFLDLNMPVMGGWEFLDHFTSEDYAEFNTAKVIVYHILLFV